MVFVKEERLSSSPRHVELKAGPTRLALVSLAEADPCNRSQILDVHGQFCDQLLIGFERHFNINTTRDQ